MINEVDSSGKGSIDFPDFLNMMAGRKRNTDKGEEIKELFKAFDKDGDGYIGFSDLKHGIAQGGKFITLQLLLNS